MVLLQASMGTAMEHNAGIDVSLESSSVCIGDGTGRVIREAKVGSEPEALVELVLCRKRSLPAGAVRVWPGSSR